MKKLLFIFFSISINLTFSGCSPINSVHPFDQEQARILANNIYPAKHSKTTKGNPHCLTPSYFHGAHLQA